jgi:hypothetical protein
MKESIAACLAAALWVACSSDNSGGGNLTGLAGQSCTSAAQCFPTLDAGALRGQIACLTQLQGGYCTHSCQTDADCCVNPAECRAGFKEVCASFESAGPTYCFLSCDPADIGGADGGAVDPNAYCQNYGNASFTCRSTGGGAQNKKFCG